MNALLMAVALAAASVPTTLPPVVVEASRLEQTKAEVASHVVTIERDEIERSGAKNTVELLEKRANLFVRKQNSNPALAQLAMRGYGANGFARVKILVDGEELNNADMSAQDLIRVPLGAIDRVEILHGPQTVLHGGDASAGVINIISNADGKDRTELEVSGGNLGTVGAHAGTVGGFADLGLAYFADLDYCRSDGWRKNSWYDIWSLKGGLVQRFANGARWSARAFFSESRYGLPGGLYADGSYGDWKPRARTADDPSSKAQNDVYGVSLSGKGVIDDENSLSADFSFRSRRSESYDYIDYTVHTLDFKLKYTNAAHPFGLDNRFDLGTDVKGALVSALAYNAKTASGGDNDYSRFSGALYARDELEILEGVSLFGGARGEWFASRDEYDLHPLAGTDSAVKGAVAGEIGVNWRPLDGVKVFAKWTRFYHAPLADELFSSYGVPNLSLAPETGHNAELGVDWTFLEDFNFTLTCFHTALEDEIMYLNYANRNAPDSTARTGLETSLVWSREKTGSAGVLYSLVDARFTDGVYDGNDVPLVPRQQLRLFAEYYLADELAIHGGYRFVGRQRYGSDFTGAGGSLPAFGIFDLGLRFKPEWKWLEGFTFAFVIDNLLNRRYSDYGEFFGAHYVYPACGRSFLFTVRYEF